MRKRRRSRIYTRSQGAAPRYWADFRDYADVGGKLEPLVAPGQRLATTDATEAALLLADRLKELDGIRRNGGMLRPRGESATLQSFAATWLVRKAEAGRTTPAWLTAMQRHLEHATGFFGSARPLTQVTPADIRRWIAALRALPNSKGGRLSDGSVRHCLNSFSNLYRGAQEAQVVPIGFNPVSATLDKPMGKPAEASWLEVPDASFLLECARQYEPRRPDLAYPGLHALIGTFLMTGGRLREVLGLETTDVNFERATVTFRPNAWRRLKNRGSARVVPLWPQLAKILRDYLNARTAGEVLEGRPARALLFPGSRRGTEACLATLPRKAFEAVLARAGMADQGITAKTFRHTYCSARLQTLDHGAPVSPFTVSRELGHGSREMVEKTYSHLGEFRCRSKVVEYRVEKHPALGERLKEHGFVTSIVTAGRTRTT
jgi:integrase